MKNKPSIAFYIILTLLSAMLAGCKNIDILNPKGVIAHTEMHLLVIATLLMLVVVIPVIILTFVIVRKYHAGRQGANYRPHQTNHVVLELFCWAVPSIIITALAILTWISTHRLDPYRPLNPSSKPLVIQVVSLDWRWLFIYPEQHIASINTFYVPLHRSIRLLITADAPMNGIQIPQLTGQIYAMPGMQTQLHFKADEVGVYRGYGTNYTGDGFAHMIFQVHATSQKQFDQWIQSVRKSSHQLTGVVYRQLAQPSKDTKIVYFSKTVDHLFENIIQRYTTPTKHL